MKATRYRFLLPLALLCATSALAQTPAQQTAPAPTLPPWERLSTADRELLLAPVRERWNAHPTERARMLERARHWQRLTPDQRRKLQRGTRRWAGMSPEQRERARAVFHETRKMTPEQRQALRAKWKAMTPEQRDAWLRDPGAGKR